MHVEVSQACTVSNTGMAPQMKCPCSIEVNTSWRHGWNITAQKILKKKRQKNINTLDLHVLLVVSHSISIPTIWNSKISLDQSSLAFLQVPQQSLSSSFGSRSSKSWKGWISCLLCCSSVLLHKLIDNFFLPPTYIHNCLSITYLITHME